MVGIKNTTIAVFLGMLVAVLFVSPPAFAEGVDPGWYYYRVITLDNTGGDALENHQVLVTLNTAIMGSPYNNVNPDGSDLRFTDADNTVRYDYWIESWDNAGESRIWVEVPSISAGTASEISMWYGNPGASSESNGDATFLLFDDFESPSLDTSKWTVTIQEEGSYEVTDGKLKLNAPTMGDVVILESIEVFAINVGLEVYSKKTTTGSDLRGPMIYRGFYYSSSDYVFTSTQFSGESWFQYITCNDGNYYATGDIGSGSSGWYKLGFFWYNGADRRASYYKDDVYQYTLTDERIPDESDSLNTYVRVAPYLSPAYDNTGYLEVDWARVRKYADPEPTISSIGDENEVGPPPGIPEFSISATLITAIGAIAYLLLKKHAAKTT